MPEPLLGTRLYPPPPPPGPAGGAGAGAADEGDAAHEACGAGESSGSDGSQSEERPIVVTPAAMEHVNRLRAARGLPSLGPAGRAQPERSTPRAFCRAQACALRFATRP
jgi:hypothetical protein